MKTIKHTSKETIDITDENGVTKEWVREFEADNMKDEFDKSHKMKIKGSWYVTRKEETEEEDG